MIVIRKLQLIKLFLNNELNIDLWVEEKRLRLTRLSLIFYTVELRTYQIIFFSIILNFLLLGFRLRKIKEIFHFTLTLVRTVMDGHGRLRTLMDAWTLMDALGRSWTIMDVLGRSWTIMDVLGRSRTLAKFCHATITRRSRDGHVHASKS